MNATDQTVARLCTEEGYRQYPYDDATGQPVKAPVGNLSWLIGLNLMAIGSKGLAVAMVTYIVHEIEMKLQSFAWYPGLPPGVQSVCQDIAYNDGLEGLLHYPHMIAALAQRDYEAAAAQCTSSNPKLQSRYKALADIIAAGI